MLGYYKKRKEEVLRYLYVHDNLLTSFGTRVILVLTTYNTYPDSIGEQVYMASAIFIYAQLDAKTNRNFTKHY